MKPAISFEPAQPSDFEALCALRLEALRESLERLGRYDPERSPDFERVGECEWDIHYVRALR